jgi:hypothetical protein
MERTPPLRPPLARRWRVALASLLAAIAGALTLLQVAMPSAAPAAAQGFGVWQSPQFGMTIGFPTTWTITEQQSDPARGDVVILGNETSALLIALLHDARTPREMALDLVHSQKEATPDLAVIQTLDTASGSVIIFMQYTINPHSASALLIDEKALLAPLQAGSSTMMIRGMVPDRADVEAQFEEIESIVATMSPAR